MDQIRTILFSPSHNFEKCLTISNKDSLPNRYNDPGLIEKFEKKTNHFN